MTDQILSTDKFLRSFCIAPAEKKKRIIESASNILDGLPPERLLYGGSKAARLISVSTQTLWRMVRAGTIKPVKIRGSTRYRRSDLERLAAGEGSAE